MQFRVSKYKINEVDQKRRKLFKTQISSLIAIAVLVYLIVFLIRQFSINLLMKETLPQVVILLTLTVSVTAMFVISTLQRRKNTILFNNLTSSYLSVSETQISGTSFLGSFSSPTKFTVPIQDILEVTCSSEELNLIIRTKSGTYSCLQLEKADSARQLINLSLKNAAEQSK